MSAPESHRTFALASLFFVAALAISGVLYARSRQPNLDRHAHMIEAFGDARHADELLS